MFDFFSFTGAVFTYHPQVAHFCDITTELDMVNSNLPTHLISHGGENWGYLCFACNTLCTAFQIQPVLLGCNIHDISVREVTQSLFVSLRVQFGKDPNTPKFLLHS